MKQRFKTGCIAAACASVLVLAGCAGTTGSSGSAKPIVIGASMQLSGTVVNVQNLAGYKQAVADVNAQGGITIDGAKRKVQLKVLDNRNDTSTMVQQVRKLKLQDGAVALLGACCQVNIDMQPQADALKVPLVMTGLPVELLPKGKGWTWLDFQSLVAGANQFYDLAKSVDTNKKIAIVTNNDSIGQGTTQLFTGSGKAAGFTIATTKSVVTGTTNFSQIIQDAKSSDSQILIASMQGPDCFAMWKQMKALGYSPKLAIGLQCAQVPGWQGLGSVGYGTLSQLSWSPTAGLPKTSELLAKYGKKFPNVADQGSVAIGYSAAQVLLDAIKRAHSVDPNKIQAALKATDLNTSLGPVKYTGNRAATGTFLGQWQDGKIQQVYPAKGAVPLKPLTGLQ